MPPTAPIPVCAWRLTGCSAIVCWNRRTARWRRRRCRAWRWRSRRRKCRRGCRGPARGRREHRPGQHRGLVEADVEPAAADHRRIGFGATADIRTEQALHVGDRSHDVLLGDPRHSRMPASTDSAARAGETDAANAAANAKPTTRRILKPPVAVFLLAGPYRGEIQAGSGIQRIAHRSARRVS